MDQKERKYDIFVSYRRIGGSIPAKWITDSLRERGYSLFLDIESLRSGPFNEKLYYFIENAKDFILIVPPNGLDRCSDEGDWVRREIEHAKEHNKNIVPIMLNDFQLPNREELPESLQFLLDINWLAPSVEFFDAFVDRLETFLISNPKRKKDDQIKRLLSYAAIVAALIAAIGFGFGKGLFSGKKPDNPTQGTTEIVAVKENNPNVVSSEQTKDDHQEQGGVEDKSVEVITDIDEWAPGSDEEAKLPDNTLMADEYAQTDSDGKIDYEKAMDYGVFGTNIKRRDIASVTFLSSLDDKPENSWDVSLKRNGKVIAWINRDNNNNNLYIAAEGGVYAPISCKRMFTGYTNLKSIEWNDALDTRYTVRMDYLFKDCISLERLDISSFNLTSVWSFRGMFYGCKNLTEIMFGKTDTKAAVYMSYMFSGCSNLANIDLSCFDTSRVTSMACMFFDCSSLESIDLSKFNTSVVTNMEYMFYRCLKIKELDLSGFSTTQVTNMDSMFRDCKALLNLNIKGFNTRAVTNMKCMFGGCSSLKEIDLSSFKTPSLAEMSYMFDECHDLETLDLSGFDTKKVTSFSRLFYDCASLKSVNLKSFVTSKVTNMGCMFEGCTSLETLDVSGFDTKNVTSMLHMFRYCSSLESLDLSGFDRSSLEKDNGMFEGCPAVVTGWDT